VTLTGRFSCAVVLVCLGFTSADAQTELLWQHSNGRMVVWKMEGSNNQSGEVLGPGQLTDPLWQIVMSGEADFNGDGWFDLVFQHQGDGRLAAWFMCRDMQLAGVALSPSQVPDRNWKVRGVADFNGDFRPDLILQNEMTGEVAAWLMRGTTRHEERFLTPSVVPDTNWRIVGVADFNLDGHSDLLWQHQTMGLIAVWYMNQLSMVDGVLLSAEVSDTNLKIRAVGDINYDGWPDLVWQNQATGLLATWLMVDRVRLASVLLSPDHVVDTNWRIVGARHRWDWQDVLNYLRVSGAGSVDDKPRAARVR